MPFVGRNEYRGQYFENTPGYREGNFQYGGSAHGADDERANLNYREHQVEGRQGPQIDQTAQNETRGFQMGSLANLQSAAQGNTPSKAEMLGQQMSDRAAHAQVAAAGSVRGGPGAQAAAYRSASQGAASQRADMNQTIQAQRADEMATARGQLSQAATSARGQDIGLASDQAHINQAQTGMNDARSMGYENLQNKVATDQLNAGMEQQKLSQKSQQEQDALAQKTAQANADKDTGLFSGATGALGGALSTAASMYMSDPQAKTPVSGGSLATLDLGGTQEGTSGASNLSADNAGDGDEEQPSPLGGSSGGSTSGLTLSKLMASNKSGNPSDAVNGKDTTKRQNNMGDFVSAFGKGMDSGSGTETSDEKAKEPAFLSRVGADSADAKPYERSDEYTKGVAGAPRGYAASRAGKPGYMFGGAPEADSSIPDLYTDKDHGKAPGAADWERYGASKDKEGDPDFKRGGMTKKEASADDKKGGVMDFISQFGRKLSESDEDAKTPVERGVLPLYEPEGKRLQQSEDGHAYLADEEKPPTSYGSSSAPAAAKAKAAPARAKEREMTPDEMLAWADRTQGEMGKAHAQRMERGPAVKGDKFDTMSDEDMAGAMRSMKPSPYAYKEGLRPPEQKPGEVNVGPMANKMQQDPVARTAIVRDPDTGLLAIDKDKSMKVVMGSLAALQDQVDDLHKDDVPRAVRAKKQRRHGEAA